MALPFFPEKELTLSLLFPSFGPPGSARGVGGGEGVVRAAPRFGRLGLGGPGWEQFRGGALQHFRLWHFL